MAEQGEALAPVGTELTARVVLSQPVVDSDHEVCIDVFLGDEILWNGYVNADMVESNLVPQITVPLNTVEDVDAFLEA